MIRRSVNALQWFRCDKRKATHHKALFALFLYLLVWFVATAAAAEEKSITGLLSTDVEMLLLVGIIQGLISYIYISGQRSTNAKFDKLFTLLDKKLDKEDHDRLCDKVGK